MSQIPTSPATPASPFIFFFLNDTATTEIYPLSLHDALLISIPASGLMTCLHRNGASQTRSTGIIDGGNRAEDRKSTRLNSSHMSISYAVFCLKKKKT